MNEKKIDYKELLFQLIHEMRQTNHIIKSSSEIISRSVSGANIERQSLEYHSMQIFESSYLVSLWLDIIDFELDSDFFCSQRMETRSLHGNLKNQLLVLNVLQSQNMYQF